LKSFQLDFNKLVGFGADGCSTNFGSKNGIAVKLRSLSPCLIAFHCPAHRLQLAILDIAEDVLLWLELLLILDGVYYSN
jgi:hypothetical protein